MGADRPRQPAGPVELVKPVTSALAARKGFQKICKVFQYQSVRRLNGRRQALKPITLRHAAPDADTADGDVIRQRALLSASLVPVVRAGCLHGGRP